MDLRNWKKKGTFLNFKNNAVFNRIDGNPKGENLLLLHNNPGCSYEFTKLIPLLEADYQILSVDLLGFGYSDKPVKYNYTLADHAEMLAVLLHISGLDEVHIIATDFSALVALELVKQQYDSRKLKEKPIKIKSCTFINAGLYPGTMEEGISNKLQRGILGKLVTLTINRSRFIHRFKSNFADASEADDAFLGALWDLSEAKEGYNVRHKVLRYPMEYRRVYRTLIRTFRNEEIPLNLIYGLEDKTLSKNATGEYKNQFPEASLTLLDSVGKFPHMEKPREVARIFNSFIASFRKLESA